MSFTTIEGQPLYSSLGGDPDLGEIVAMFVDEMPERIGMLETLFAAGEWDELRRVAHQLKGAAGSYGFAPITPSAARLEEAIRDDRPEEQVRRACQELVVLCRRARTGTPQ